MTGRKTRLATLFLTGLTGALIASTGGVYAANTLENPSDSGEAGMGQAQVYVTSLSDIPVMNGLTELRDEGYMFDAPEGRVVQVVLFGNKITTETVRNYYNGVFPQLGWIARKTGLFVRSGEQLTVAIEENKDGVIVILEVSPESDQK
ncbi:MAG: hypothetical protein RBR86_04910 [Pseudobdellovibrionaceae bacterium]|jgi:hypothetical protein|nr:hypothetical protein [Pseudobdellovibrionaceae bacterium]